MLKASDYYWVCDMYPAMSIIWGSISVWVGWITMQINVSQLLKEPVGSERDYQINDTLDIMDNDSSSMVQGNIRLTRTDRSILVKGNFNTTVELACARCLDVFVCPLTLSFEEEYIPASNIASGDFLPPSDESGLFRIDDNQVIDLTEAIRQYALMALPMKPLCRQDCSGL